MAHKIKLLVLACVLFNLFFSGLSSIANAQNASSTSNDKQNKSALAVSPAIVEHIVPPGKPKQFTLRVTNMTEFPLPISGTVKNFITIEEVISPERLKLYDASKWFTLSEPDFILQPRQTKEVVVTVEPPEGSEPGGHYATIYFQPLLPQGVLTPATAYLSARVGSLAFLIVPGEFVEEIRVTDFKSPFLHQSGPLEMTATLQNLGNVHLSPNSKVIVRTIFDNKITEIPFTKGIILPSTKKEFTASWEKPALFGIYKASIETTYGASNTKVSSSTILFWVFPWSLLLLIAALVVALIFSIRRREQLRHAWAILRGKPI